MIVSCSQCGVKLKIDETKITGAGVRLKCPKCANIFSVQKPQEASAPQFAPAQPQPPRPAPQAPPQPQRPVAPPAPPQPQPVQRPVAPPPPPVRPSAPPVSVGPKWALDRRKIVVGQDGEAQLALIKDLLTDAGYEVIPAKEGIQAVVAIEQHKPFLAILDVALPRIYGFEICDRVKNSPESSDMKVILIASIYDKTKYKREPESLYGADDYIEKHHIPDCLVDKVRRLGSGQPGPGQRPVREEEVCRRPAPEEMPVREQQAVVMKRDEFPSAPSQPQPRQAPPAAAAGPQADPQQVEAARRFARIILSDIALYNQSAVEEGIRNGNFYNLLTAELKEGRDLYNNRVPTDVRSGMDYFQDETEKFIEKKRRTMGVEGKI